jgi:hypothetical protein
MYITDILNLVHVYILEQPSRYKYDSIEKTLPCLILHM